MTRILIIEDHHETARSLEDFLVSQGCTISSTDLGEEGVDLGRIYKYSAIILDLTLPDMAGLDVLRQLRAAGVVTPVLIISGSSDIETKKDAFSEGADDYLTKPFHPDELLCRLKIVIRRVGAPMSPAPGGVSGLSKELRTDKCSRCGHRPSVSCRVCAVCQSDVGYPNVRLADTAAERDELIDRVLQARQQIERAGVGPQAEMLQAAMDDVHIVFNRTLASLHTWLLSDSPQFVSFYRQLTVGRTPTDSVWDLQRSSTDNTANPLSFPEISYAALSCNYGGMPYYGGYTVILKEEDLLHRTSLFEENPFSFCKAHGLAAGDKAPPGHRSTWENRGSLALAKLSRRLKAEMTPDDMAELIMEPRGETADCDFIEAHIFGPIHRRSIAMVVGPEPTDEFEALLWPSVKHMLSELGVEVEVTS